MNKNVLYAFLIYLVTITNVLATPIDTNTAKLQAMDKITGRVSVIEVPVNGEKKFGSISVVVRSCQTRPVEETPDNFAFIDITDTDLQGKEYNIFKGWMISSSPATNALEHPIYDVWLLQCINTSVDPKQLLSQEQLTLRDNLSMSSANPQKDNQASQTSDNQLSIGTNIQEMPSVQNDEPKVENLLMPDEFSFDEDEEVEVEIEEPAENSEDNSDNKDENL